jgi:hypothetical protein
MGSNTSLKTENGFTEPPEHEQPLSAKKKYAVTERENAAELLLKE